MEPRGPTFPFGARRVRCMVNPSCPIHGVGAGRGGPWIRPMIRPYMGMPGHGGTRSCMGMPGHDETRSCLGMRGHGETRSCMGMPGYGETRSCMGMPGHGETRSCMGMPGHGETRSCMGIPGHGETQSCMGTPGHHETQSCMGMPGHHGSQSCMDMPGHGGTQSCMGMPGHRETQSCMGMPGHHGSQSCMGMSGQPETHSCPTTSDEPGLMTYMNIADNHNPQCPIHAHHRPAAQGQSGSALPPNVPVAASAPRQPTTAAANHQQPDWIRDRRVAYLMDGTPIYVYPSPPPPNVERMYCPSGRRPAFPEVPWPMCPVHPMPGTSEATLSTQPAPFVDPKCPYHTTLPSNAPNSEHLTKDRKHTHATKAVEEHVEDTYGNVDQTTPSRDMDPVYTTFETKRIAKLPEADMNNEKPKFEKRCSRCDTKFLTRKDLNAHVASIFHCSLCKKKFCIKRLFDVHIQSHSDNKLPQCEICGKLLKRRTSLKAHYRIHTGEKPFPCEFCGRCFTQKIHKILHIARKHDTERSLPEANKRQVPKKTQVKNTKPPRCKICRKQFNTYKGLVEHFRPRAGKRPFSSQICSKTFTFESDRRRHIVVCAGK